MSDRFKSLFECEEARREQLRSAVTMPVGVLTVIVSLLGTTLVSYWKGSGWLHCLFSAFWITAIVSAIFAVVFLVRSYHGHKYKGMPTPLPLWAYLSALRQWHEKYGSTEQALADFEAYLEHHYATAGDYNTKRNDIRSELLFLANRAVVLTAVFAALAYIPYTVSQLARPPIVTHVIVDSIPRLQSESNVQPEKGPPASSTSAPQAARPPAPRPPRGSDPQRPD
jgi:hypothetical protein